MGRRIPLAKFIGIDDPGELEIGTSVPGEPGPCCLGLINQISGNGLFDSGHGLILRHKLASEIGIVILRIQSDAVGQLSFFRRRLTWRSRSPERQPDHGPSEPPGSRDYNNEGTAELTPEAHTAGRPRTTGRMLSVVAGEGFEPPTSGL